MYVVVGSTTSVWDLIFLCNCGMAKYSVKVIYDLSHLITQLIYTLEYMFSEIFAMV